MATCRCTRRASHLEASGIAGMCTDPLCIHTWHNPCSTVDRPQPTLRSCRRTPTAGSLHIYTREGHNGMAQQKKTKGHNGKRRADAIAMLKADHQKVRDLFQQYAAALDRDTKRSVANVVFIELETHVQLEEHVFYPAVNEETDDGPEIIKEAMQEHQTVKDLMQELQAMGPDAKGFDAKFQELIRNVEHHIAEEESQMFPLAEAELEEDMQDLKDEMQDLKDEMQDLKAQLLAS
jgi:hemerythrin-like domain-containing protein